MNKRIAELAKQSGYYPLEGFDFANSLEEILQEKFALLIIRECISIVNETGDDVENGDIFNSNFKHLKSVMESDYKHLGGIAWHASDMIKEHFGIEE